VSNGAGRDLEEQLVHRVNNGPEFELSFEEFSGGIRLCNYSRAGVGGDLVIFIVDLPAPKRNRPVAVPIGVDPSHRTGVSAPVKALVGVNEIQGSLRR
jgi:hypothetical protein